MCNYIWRSNYTSCSSANKSPANICKYYQGFVSFINESVMEDSQALISPDTHKLGDIQKPVRQKSGKAKRFRNIDL